MRRGRIFIYLALIIIVGVAGVALYYWKGRPAASHPPVGTQTPQVRYVEIITAGQNIYPGTIITEAMLNSFQIPEDKLVQGLFTKKADLVNKYAKYALMQGVPITDSMVSSSPGNVNLPGAPWAPLIPQGLTAVSIPIDDLSSTAYGIRDGDYVDVIVTMLMVDVDPALQTVLPNKIEHLQQITNTAGIPSQNSGLLDLTPPDGPQGHYVIDQIPTDPVSSALLYVIPSEQQRPRLVTQMIMQNIQVLHMGTFPLPGEPSSDQLTAAAAATPTPAPANQPQATPVIVQPKFITMMVSPQDAVTLTYLLFSKAKITLTLRNPYDLTPISQPDAAMLEYLLTQYNIPVPAKLPYSFQPRLDELQQSALPTK